MADRDLHVFHQFRPRQGEGSRWAHQIASDVPYDWDVCDDVLAPQGDEIDVLAGSSIKVSADPSFASAETENAVELFFVTSTPLDPNSDKAQLQGNNIDHGSKGSRRFQIQRAHIPDVTELLDVSDDPSPADHRVERLGPIDIDDSAHSVQDLVAPNVLWHEGSWLMIALSLTGETDAEVVVLRSTDRQSWKVLGALEVSPEAELPEGRPFAPRLVSLQDEATGKDHDVLFVTYPNADNSRESTGYVVGKLDGAKFAVTTPYTVLDFGHDFTRPRVISGDQPVMFGLVGAHPDFHEQWANCLSSPRFLTLLNGHIFQDVVGASRAVKGYSDRALIWTSQLDCSQGSVNVDILNKAGDRVTRITHDGSTVTLTRNEGDSVSAQLSESSSSTLTVFVDGPICEIFVDGGALSLTSAIPTDFKVDSLQAEVSGGAEIINSMLTVGQEIMRSSAGLDSPEDQERFIAEAIEADRAAAHGEVSEDSASAGC